MPLTLELDLKYTPLGLLVIGHRCYLYLYLRLEKLVLYPKYRFPNLNTQIQIVVT
jgi:hypothetical protein